MITATIKIGSNKGRPRIWLEGKRLLQAGFIGGTTYKCEVGEGMINLTLPGADRKVTGRPDGKPIIDLLGRDVETAFAGESHVAVEFEAGSIRIRRAEAIAMKEAA